MAQNQNLTNEGTLTLAKAGKLYVDGDMLTTGQLNVGADSYLDVTGAFTTTGGSIHLDGVVRASSLTVDGATSLSGAGHFVGNVENNGIVSPGNSTGLLTVTGDYTQSADATLAIGIDGFVNGGIGIDQLVIDEGNATLDGILDVTLTNGFALSEGQLFTIIAAAGQLVDNGLQLVGSAADYFDMLVHTGVAGSVVLQFLGGDFPLPGDYNGDNFVDAADYTVWRDGLGGAFTETDYGEWKNYFGAAAGGGAGATAAVPEPATLMLLILAASGVSLRRRRP